MILVGNCWVLLFRISGIILYSIVKYHTTQNVCMFVEKGSPVSRPLNIQSARPLSVPRGHDIPNVACQPQHRSPRILLVMFGCSINRSTITINNFSKHISVLGLIKKFTDDLLDSTSRLFHNFPKSFEI